MDEAPLGFLEVEVECVFGHTVELYEPHLGHAPEALDAIDVNRAAGELIAGMVEPKLQLAAVGRRPTPRDRPSIELQGDHTVVVHRE